jgi:RND superfamily putative drug exporter
MAKSSVTLRTARWSAEHPWRAILIWILFLAAAVGLGSAVSTVGTTDADYRVGDSGVADRLITDAGLAKPGTENVLVTSRSGQLSAAEANAVAHQVTAGMGPLPLVRSVATPAWAPHHQAMLVTVTLRGSPVDPDVTPLQAVTDRAQAAHPDLQVEEVGDASVNAAVNERVGRDLASAEHISLPVTLIIMLLAFGAIVAAGIPVVLAISAVVATIGLLGPLSHLVPAEDTVSSMVLLIGMAVGVDYSLFYLKRAREERRKARSALDAVEIAAATSGHSIVVSGLAVIVSMAGLYIAQDVTFASLASGAILVVAVAVIGSLTVLPALLVKFGRFVDRPRIPILGKRMEKVESGAISRRILAPVMRRPGVAFVVAGAAIVAMALPALGMKVHEGTISTLPQDIPQVQTMQRVEKLFPWQGDTLQVVAETSPRTMPRVEQALTSLNRAASEGPGFRTSARPAIDVSADRTVAALTLTTPYGEGNPAAESSLTQLRDVLGPRQLDSLPGTQWVVGGRIAQSIDSAQHQRDKLPYVIGFVLLLTLLMMGIAFRSVTIALITTLLNLASVGAAFGVLTLVFQHSWANGLLGYTSSGFVVDWIPLFTFVVLMGLSMDYHVFVLSRVREGVARGLPPRLAVEAGVSRTAGVVTSAAAVMVSVFAIFASLSMLEMKQIGVGLAAAVLIDATLIRVVLLPAMLALLGKVAWWPSRVRRPAAQPVVVTEPKYASTSR